MSDPSANDTGCALGIVGFLFGVVVTVLFGLAQQTHEHVKSMEKENAELRARLSAGEETKDDPHYCGALRCTK